MKKRYANNGYGIQTGLKIGDLGTYLACLLRANDAANEAGKVSDAEFETCQHSVKTYQTCKDESDARGHQILADFFLNVLECR